MILVSCKMCAGHASSGKMSVLTGFANLACGDRLNINTPLIIAARKKTNDSISRRLANYREHFKTDHVNVPETNVRELGALFDRLTFKLPSKYIEYKPPEALENTIEYDIDEEDSKWIEMANAERIRSSVEEISVEKFEIAIDRMEKCCKFEPLAGNLGPSNAQASCDDETDDVCCVCADGDVSNANQIIYCDMCNIAVHQDCYGVPYIPEGSWLCRKCKLSPSEPVKCCLCPHPFGAFKPTSDGRWAHVVCAIWLNEVHFGNAVFLEPIEGVKECLKERKILRCLYCRKKHGACIQCSSRSCIKAFHVTCAQQLGLAMKVETVLDKDDGEEIDVKRFVYCQKHAAGNNMTKREIEQSIRKARRNMESSGAYRPTITMPTISRENVDRIARETGIEKFEDVVVYWYQKRRSRAGVPLIRRLNVEVAPKERKRANSTVVALSSAEKALYEQFQRIRNSLETTRMLSELIKKREVNKRGYLIHHRKLFEKSLMPIEEILSRILDEFDKEDEQNVFAEPVQLDGYLTIIKNPMDLSTMRRKCANRKYSSVNDLRKDLLLMTDNCAKFNHDNRYYLRYGKKFRKAALSILDEAEKMANETIHSGNKTAEFVEIFTRELGENFLRQKIRIGGDEPEAKRSRNEPIDDDFGAGPSSQIADDIDEDEQIDGRQKSKTTTPSSSRNRGRGRPVMRTTPTDVVVVVQSPIEQDEQLESETSIAPTPKSGGTLASSWKSIFTGAVGQVKRKSTFGATATTPKRKKELAANQTILPFLSTTTTTTSEPPLTFSAIAKSGANSPLVLVNARNTRNVRNNPHFSGVRDYDAVKSPLPADSASSTECSTDEDVVPDEATNVRKKNGSAKPKRKSFPRLKGGKESPVEKAKMDCKSKFAHNAIVNVDGKAAKVIDSQYAHLSDISREQRQQMFATRPHQNGASPRNRPSYCGGGGDDDHLVYVEFFQKTNNSEQYKWVPSERVTLLDMSNTNKAKIVGLKAAKEW
ncbi:unnamed protein product [Caenorhabditis bovis]|uniref:Uncharacterized protein n=1 Tax=Caenorhabditis bovis TaxID=2654633 RepID=A0A8S1F384_9PELO|nr:unnamed protein product [Caenorhabditis bovis]